MVDGTVMRNNQVPEVRVNEKHRTLYAKQVVDGTVKRKNQVPKVRINEKNRTRYAKNAKNINVLRCAKQAKKRSEVP